MYCIVETFKGENFTNFEVLHVFKKVFSVNFFGGRTSEQSAEVFYIFHQCFFGFLLYDMGRTCV